jgi:hypothetical protein
MTSQAKGMRFVIKVQPSVVVEVGKKSSPFMTGTTALLPLRRKSCYGFFIAIKNHRARPGLNPRTLSPMTITLPLDHRGRLYGYTYIDSFIFIYRLYNLIFSVAMTNDLHNSSKATRVSVERFRALYSKLLSPV